MIAWWMAAAWAGSPIPALEGLERDPHGQLLVLPPSAVPIAVREELWKEPWITVRAPGGDPYAAAGRRLSRGWECVAVLGEDLAVNPIGRCGPSGFTGRDPGWTAESVGVIPRSEELHLLGASAGVVGGALFAIGYAQVAANDSDVLAGKSLFAARIGGGLLFATPPLALGGSWIRRARYRKLGIRVNDVFLIASTAAFTLGEVLLVTPMATTGSVSSQTAQLTMLLGGLGVVGLGIQEAQIHRARVRTGADTPTN